MWVPKRGATAAVRAGGRPRTREEVLATSIPRNSLYLTRRRKPVPRLISLKYSGFKKKKNFTSVQRKAFLAAVWTNS